MDDKQGGPSLYCSTYSGYNREKKCVCVCVCIKGRKKIKGDEKKEGEGERGRQRREYMYSVILVMYTRNISFKLHVQRSQNTCTTCSQHTHTSCTGEYNK